MRIQTLEEYYDEIQAIHEGRATQLIRCDECIGWKFGEHGPLRGVVREERYEGPDPGIAVVLTCGHILL